MQKIQHRQARRPLLVEVQVVDGGGGLYLHRARNLSAGGLFMDAPVPLPTGTRLALSFRLPGSVVIRADASVRWNTEGGGAPARHPGMGIVFHHLDSEQQLAIVQWVEALPG